MVWINSKSNKWLNDFKLLAIRPLVDCEVKFRKKLKEGVIYKFHQGFSFLYKNGNEIGKKNKLENIQLSELRDYLLPMLMNGQVKVG